GLGTTTSFGSKTLCPGSWNVPLTKSRTASRSALMSSCKRLPVYGTVLKTNPAAPCAPNIKAQTVPMPAQSGLFFVSGWGSDILGGHNVHAGAAHVGQDDLPDADWGGQLHRIQGSHHGKNHVFGHRAAGLDGAAGPAAAGAFDGGGHHPGGMDQLGPAIGFAPGTAVAGDGVAVFVVHLQVAALRA